MYRINTPEGWMEKKVFYVLVQKTFNEGFQFRFHIHDKFMKKMLPVVYFLMLPTI